MASNSSWLICNYLLMKFDEYTECSRLRKQPSRRTDGYLPAIFRQAMNTHADARWSPSGSFRTKCGQLNCK